MTTGTDTYITAFDHTLKIEGGYVHDLDDAGGETYRGIARRFHPSWPGWVVIDQARGEPGFPANLDQPGRRKALDPLVLQFYRQNFWDAWQGDRVAELSPAVAMEIFDSAVNAGVNRAVAWFQKSLNALNRNNKLYPDLVVDGSLGSTSLSAFRAYLRTDSTELLLKIMNILQGSHYIEFMTKSPVQEKYARGWFARVNITKP